MSNTSILTKKIFESILAEVRERAMSNGLSPLLLMKKKSGERFSYHLPEMPERIEDRQQAFQMLGFLFRQDGTIAQEAIFICEAWVVMVREMLPIDCLPSEHPARQEAIVMVGRNADNNRCVQLIQPYSRDEDGKPVWHAVKIEMGQQGATGLLDDFFAGQQHQEVLE